MVDMGAVFESERWREIHRAKEIHISSASVWRKTEWDGVMGATHSDRASLACTPGHLAPTSPVARVSSATGAFQIDYCIGSEGGALHRVSCNQAILPPDPMRSVASGKDGICARDGRDRRSAAGVQSRRPPLPGGCAQPGTNTLKHRAPSTPKVVATGLPGGRSGPFVCPPTSPLDLAGVALRHPRTFCAKGAGYGRV